MSEPVAIRDVRLRSRTSEPTSAPETNPAADAYQLQTASAPLRYGPYRKTHRDMSFFRLIAASVILIAVLLNVGPTALGEVKRLIAGIPDLYTHGLPTPGMSGSDASYLTSDTAPADIGAQNP